MVSVLPGHMLLEDARHSHRTRRSRKDPPDRRIGYGAGELSLRAITLCVAALGVRCVRSREERRHIELVENREAATLISIIQRVVVPGASIWSDEWAAYRTLSQLGYTHQTVNHSRNFKNPVTGVCTNHVEAYWCSVKRRFKSMVGTSADMVPFHLDEFMWCERFGSTSSLVWLNIQ